MWRHPTPSVAYGVLLVIAVVTLDGCMTPQSAQLGIVEQVVASGENSRAADVTTDFVFRSASGELGTFSESRDDITILVFPCEKGWPDCERCALLQKLAHQLGGVHSNVTVVSLLIPEDSCDLCHHKFRECNIQGYADLIALCPVLPARRHTGT